MTPVPQPDHIEVIARGLLIERGQVLLCQNLSHGHHYLPGGHVESGEPAAVALCREFLEETGQPVNVGPLLLTMEQLFTQRGRARHEISMVFHVERRDTNDITSQEPGIAFIWAPMTSLPASLLPTELAAWITSSSPRPHWIVSS